MASFGKRRIGLCILVRQARVAIGASLRVEARPGGIAAVQRWADLGNRPAGCQPAPQAVCAFLCIGTDSERWPAKKDRVAFAVIVTPATTVQRGQEARCLKCFIFNEKVVVTAIHRAQSARLAMRYQFIRGTSASGCSAANLRIAGLPILRLNSRPQDFRPAWTVCSGILLGGNKHIEALQRSDGFEGRL
jgi:hypothetical protein